MNPITRDGASRSAGQELLKCHHLEVISCHYNNNTSHSFTEQRALRAPEAGCLVCCFFFFFPSLLYFMSHGYALPLTPSWSMFFSPPVALFFSVSYFAPRCLGVFAHTDRKVVQVRCSYPLCKHWFTLSSTMREPGILGDRLHRLVSLW